MPTDCILHPVTVCSPCLFTGWLCPASQTFPNSAPTFALLLPFAISGAVSALVCLSSAPFALIFLISSQTYYHFQTFSWQTHTFLIFLIPLWPSYGHESLNHTTKQVSEQLLSTPKWLDQTCPSEPSHSVYTFNLLFTSPLFLFMFKFCARLNQEPLKKISQFKCR